MPESKENSSRKSVREQEERERKWQEGGISVCLNRIGESGVAGGTGAAASAEGESRARNHN